MQTQRSARVWPRVEITQEVIDQILAMGMERAPLEACGIILGGLETGGTQVIELFNRSPDPENAYVIERDDIVDAVNSWDAEFSPAVPTDFGHYDIVVWHTHPNGFIGPSRGDLEHREPGCRYLVVNLPTHNLKSNPADTDGRAVGCQY